MSGRRHFLVGFTVLLSLGVLAVMIVQFGGQLPSFLGGGRIPVVLDAPRANNLSVGSAVTFAGVSVGQVTAITRTAEHNVIIEAELDTDPPLPANLEGAIRQTNLLGTGAVVELTTDGDPQGIVAKGAVIPTRFAGNEIFPPEFLEAADEMRRAVAEFRRSGVIDDLKTQLANIGQTVTSANDLITDEELRGRIDQTMANLESASARADTALASLEQFGTEDLPALRDRADQLLETGEAQITRAGDNFEATTKNLTRSLTEFDRLAREYREIAAKINRGEGTAGQLLNDDRVYEAALTVLLQLEATVKDVQRLTQQLEQDGVKIGF
jgi:phospholipid/cholesterol/gamma-HCH transport system substrate-binding protein